MGLVLAKQRSSMKNAEADLSRTAQSMEDGYEQDAQIKFVDNKLLLRLFNQKPNVTRSYIGDEVIFGI